MTRVKLAGDDVTRVSAAVNLYCRPRLLRRALTGKVARSPARQEKLRQTLAEPADDSDFIALYGQASWALLNAREATLLILCS